MSIFEAIVLGLIQGLTEFLPISSSGHLRVFSAFFGWPDPGAAFTAVSQIGTELAVILYFRKRIWAIISTWTRSLVNRELRRDINARMGWYVIIGTIPIGVLGLTLEDYIESVFRDLRLIALTLIVFGVILGAVDRYTRKHRELSDLTVGRGLIFGLFQTLALIPGVSRSGATVTGGMLLGFKRADAAEYAFLLALPAVFASGLYQLTDIGGDEYAGWTATIVGTVVAFAVGYAVIAWLMRFISTHSFMPFVYYRIALGVLILTLVSFGVLAPQSGATGDEAPVGTESEQSEQEEARDEPEASPSAEPSPSPSPSASVDPVTGWPIDPETGLAQDPETGQHRDPDTGENVQIDPNTGLPIDPYTGQPYDPRQDDAQGGAGQTTGQEQQPVG
ncbi:undecaprenyl-diphosphate phosphatase [Streptomonospora sp. S1-112]|uniref:Undecaprenyl-diphosphatase n=1 Tax=Streptomonospora mangrovi TaxID=2883123 RepID=A0A9X3SGA9_9ACTN|nr:undecaprenyl-diphosphate phosphatase [Streptomonospora mangrovi]MDA0566697.1 undecaprenyl-diphosphate phosphatase [Streptomonospora mangrovi]